jgi:hypothetical protein
MVNYFIKPLFVVLSLLLLLYLILPFGPRNIEDFSNLPESSRSGLSGDTVQIPNLKAFFSNNYRHFVTTYYYIEFWRLSKFPFPPLRLNHPPEYAFQAIKDQTQSTYLEEYTYPFRGTLYVNGLEPFDEITKKERYPAASYFTQKDKSFETKVTIKYYPTSLFPRIITWIGINISIILLYYMGRKIFRND